jgi:hypothetical protein
MNRITEQEVQRDIETPDTIRVRFGIEFLEANLADANIAISMPMAGLRNPFTGSPAVGLLAILVDAAGGMSNHYRRRTDQWTVTTELTPELSPAEWADVEEPVLARARPLGPVGGTTLALCTLSQGGAVIGAGTAPILDTSERHCASAATPRSAMPGRSATMARWRAPRG